MENQNTKKYIGYFLRRKKEEKHLKYLIAIAVTGIFFCLWLNTGSANFGMWVARIGGGAITVFVWYDAIFLPTFADSIILEIQTGKIKVPLSYKSFQTGTSFLPWQ